MSLLIGVASYLSPTKLADTLRSIVEETGGHWECLIVHNEEPSNPDVEEATLAVIHSFCRLDVRFSYIVQPNTGYCGAVNRLLQRAIERGDDYVAYCDNDVRIGTSAWNTHLVRVLEENPDCGWVFPGDGHYPMENGKYRECLWHAGYCWMMRIGASTAMRKRESAMFLPSYLPAGLMNDKLGHHEEVEYMVRMRMAGFNIGCVPRVQVDHLENSTSSPESAKRIHSGVVRWMNFSNQYFVGDAIKYPNPDPDSGEGYDPRALRYNRWPPCALYMERWTLAQFPDINKNPEVAQTSAGPMDIIKVLRDKGYYHERSI